MRLLFSALMVAFAAESVRADQPARPLDTEFLIKVAPCAHAQVEIAKLADKRAESAKVKEFAAQLQADHQKCHDKVAEVMKNRKIAIVSGFEKDVQAEIDRLGKLSGADFDREYLAYVIKTHEEGIPVMENQSKNGKEADIRNLSDEAIPKMQEHLKKAKELAKR